MSADAGAAPLPPGVHRIAVIAALGLERASLARQPRAAQLLLLQSGPGPDRAASAARAALAQGAAALVSWGFAGGLDPALPPGSIVVPRTVRTPDGASFAADHAWRAALAVAGSVAAPVSDGAILSVPAALLTPAAKTAAARGAVAADMESAAIAAVAASAGAPFAAVRVIVDAHGDSLPADAEQWIDERGNRRVASAVGAAFRPAQWRALWILANRYRIARGVLDRLAAVLVAQRFCAAPSAAAATG